MRLWCVKIERRGDEGYSVQFSLLSAKHAPLAGTPREAELYILYPCRVDFKVGYAYEISIKGFEAYTGLQEKEKVAP